jgi:hypothetical protein
MADTGVKGVDLYVMHPDSTWQYVNTCRPNPDSLKYCSRKLVERLEPTMKEFMIYLPLYDGVEQVSVEVDSAAIITPGNIDLPSDKGRIVTYGTSIMQGGCASRTGMAAPAIIQRETGRQVVNMGFSGEGKMDLVMARALAEIPNVSLYVIDPVPNCTDQMCDSLTVPFISRLRQLAPGIPIIMVEGPIYPYARYDSYYGEYLPRKNAIFRRGYEALRAAGITDLYYLEATEINGPDYQGTVDGIHLTDLGFRNYADRILPLIRSILGKE